MSAPSDASSRDPARLVCRCLGVSSRRILRVIRAGRLCTLGQVQAATRAGSGCGTCHPEIQEMLADLAGAPYPAAQRLQNREVCRSETHARVERALLGWIGPGVAEKTSLEVISVRGLRVVVRLAADDPAARARILERLRKSVCEELEVGFSPAQEPR
jgi:bacterioferritin-associated ferredoxin